MVVDILFIIVIILILASNLFIRIAAKETKETPNGSGLSGFEIARKVSSHFSENEPHIIKKSTKFLDHYNKDRNVIKLSPEVFDGEDVYAAIIAINTALETDEERRKVPITRKLNSFLVIASYIMIILGVFANNMLVIRLGMVLFMITFIIEFILISSLFINEEEIEKLFDLVKKEKLVKPIEEYKDNFVILSLTHLATLPYSFINYFR